MLRVDSSRQEKCLLRGYFDFWITHGGTRCCVYLELPEENILFSNLIFIILPFSLPSRHSKEWIHYADTVRKHFFFFLKSNLFRFFPIQVCRRFSSAEPHVLPGIPTLWFHFCGNNFKGTTLGRWDVKLLWSSTHVCGMLVPLCTILTFFLFILLFAFLSRHSKNK